MSVTRTRLFYLGAIILIGSLFFGIATGVLRILPYSIFMEYDLEESSASVYATGIEGIIVAIGVAASLVIMGYSYIKYRYED